MLNIQLAHVATGKRISYSCTPIEARSYLMFQLNESSWGIPERDEEKYLVSCIYNVRNAFSPPRRVPMILGQTIMRKIYLSRKSSQCRPVGLGDEYSPHHSLQVGSEQRWP